MPTVLQSGPYRFFFYSEEGNEPPHVHIEAAEKRAKYWLKPTELSWNDGFRSGELKTIEKLLSMNINLLLEGWHAFFASK
jgi:Domain of unknown function (DUF4160)